MERRERRIAPVPPKEWPADFVTTATDALRTPDGHPVMSADRPKGLAVLETFARHPELAEAYFPFNGHVLYGTTLTLRQRQLAIMRVAVRRRCQYLWAQHIFTAREIGLTDEEVARIAFGPEAPCLDRLESAILRAVDEMVDDGTIGDDTWSDLAGSFDDRQMMDLIFTVGCYETIACFMNAARLEVDPRIPELLANPDDGRTTP